jgi:urea carboxylase
MWNRYKQTDDFTEGKPWLLRFFDQLRFYPVSQDELKQMREDFPHGRFNLKIEPTTLKLRDYREFLQSNADSIAAFKQRQQASFDDERARWEANGQANYEADLPDELGSSDAGIDIPHGCIAVASPVTGSAWEIPAEVGDKVAIGDTLVVVEAMKMEIPIEADEAGTIKEVLVSQGSPVSAGQALMIIELEEA